MNVRLTMVAVSKSALIHQRPICVSVMMGICWILTTAMVHVASFLKKSNIVSFRY